VTATSAYQGSQAFNQTVSALEFVNHNTGSLTLSRNLAGLRGPTASSGLSLSLRYCQSAIGAYGLPPSWNLNIPFILKDGVDAQSLTMPNGTYVICEPRDQPSGLRYVNRKGVAFKQHHGFTPAPLSKRAAAYTYANGNGQTLYFDASGRFFEQSDQFGAGRVVTYLAGDTDAISGRISQIQVFVTDAGTPTAFGPPLNFSYQSRYGLALRLGDTSLCSVGWTDTGDLHVDENGQRAMRVTSTTYLEQQVVSRIQYWSGLISSFDYQGIDYFDSDRKTKQFVAVAEHRQNDAGGDVLSKTQYAFGDNTAGRTFTGHRAGLTLSQSEDALIELADPTFQYDVTVRRLDSTGALTSKSVLYYNTFHAPSRTDHYNDDAAQPTFRTEYGYDHVGKSAVTSPNYNKPTSKTVVALSAQAATPLLRETYTYDDYGKDTGKSVYLNGSETAASSEAHCYQETSWGGTVPAMSTFTEAGIDRTTRHTFKLAIGGKCYASVVTDYSEGGSDTWTKWKTVGLVHDELGRVLSRTVSWTPTSTSMGGDRGLSSSTVGHSYASTSTNYTVKTTNPLGGVSTALHDLTIVGGPLVTFTDPDNVTTTHTYDDLGRLSSTTEPNGETTQFSYTVAGLQPAPGAVNSVTSRRADGYAVRRYMDALERDTGLYDNGGGTSPKSEPTRLLRGQTFDAAGRLASISDDLGKTTTFAYDMLGRMVAKTTPDKQTATMAYDNAAGTCTVTVAGVKRSVHTSDPLGRVTRVDTYPETDTPDVDYFLSAITTYSGRGQALTHTASNYLIATPATCLNWERISLSWDVESRLASWTRTTSASAGSKETLKHTRDLLGNIVQSNRAVEDESAGTLTAAGETVGFNATGLVATVETAGGVEERCYFKSGRIKSLSRPEGQFDYGYTAGKLTSITGPSDSIAYEYWPNHRLKSITAGTEKISYDYLPDGALTSISYPGAPGVSIVSDEHDQITSVTDQNGVETTTSFYDDGRLQSRAQNGQILTFGYADGTNRLESIAFSGNVDAMLTCSFDDFGRPSGSVLKDAQGKDILNVAVQRDWSGRISSMAVKSDVLAGATAANAVTTFEYDWRGHLASRTVAPTDGPATTESFTYDAADNVKTVTVAGQTRSYDYNGYNQLTGDTRYDANGRMLADGSGTSYGFDDWDRLTTRTGADGTSALAYWPDGSLKSVTEGGTTTTFAYAGGAVAGITDGERSTSLLQAFGTAHAATGGTDTTVALLGTANGSTTVQSGTGGTSAIGYDAYGKPSGDAGDRALPTWTQQVQLPGSGLTYLRARWHDPALRRFISADPTRQFNRYAYCEGDPANLTDTTGLMPAWLSDVIGISLAIGLDVLTDGAAAGLYGEEAAALDGEENFIAGAERELGGLEKEADGLSSKVGQDERLEGELTNTRGKLKNIRSELNSRKIRLNEARKYLLSSNRGRLGRLLSNKYAKGMLVSVTEDVLHRVATGEELDKETLESFGLDVLTSVFFAWALPMPKDAGFFTKASLFALKQVIGSSVHRQFGLGGLSFVPPIGALADASVLIPHNGGTSWHEAFASAVGASTVPVSLSNGEADFLAVSGAAHGPSASGLAAVGARQHGSLSVLSTLGAVSSAAALAESVQYSVFDSGPALHAMP